MDAYSIAIVDSDKQIVMAVKEVLECNPQYSCLTFTSPKELLNSDERFHVVIINQTLISVAKAASYSRRIGAALLLILDEDTSHTLYGIESIHPIITKPLRASEILTTVHLLITNMITAGELKVYSHYSTLLNSALNLIQGNADQPLTDTIIALLQLLYSEFHYDLISFQLRDDQFDDTHKECILYKGVLLGGESELYCKFDKAENGKEQCLCELLKTMPEDQLKQIGTPRCSLWSNELEEYVEELKHLSPPTVITSRCTKMHLQSLSLMRIMSNGKLIGIISIGDEKKHIINEKIIQFFEDLADGIGDLLWKRKLSDNIKEIHSDLDQAYKSGKFAMWKYYIDKDLFYFSEDFFNLTQRDSRLNQSNLSDFLISIQYDDREKVLNCFNKVINKEVLSNSCDFRFRSFDSDKLKYFKLSLTFSKVNNSIRGVIEDITEKEVALLTVQDTKEFLDSILNGMDAGIIVIDPLKNSVIDVNKEAETLLRKTSEELLEIKGTRFLSSHYFKKSKSLISFSNSSDNFEELLLKTDDGALTPVLRNMITTSWRGRKHYVVIIFDITDRKNLEQQLNHAQKMESIGSLAAGIAHEINTPMQYIGDNLGFIKDAMTSYMSLIEKFEEITILCKENNIYDEQVKELAELKEELDIDFMIEEAPMALEQALDGVARVTKIVKAMKKFSHPGEEEMALTDINDIISNTIIVAKNEWKYFADMVEELDNDLPLVYCNGNDISQVILNMIVNASHAIEDIVKESGNKGQITLRTKAFDNHIHIYIKDTGSGISPENFTNIFNPFFTTKEVGKGTGQGLSMAYSIITEKHKGKLTFTSTVGEGTEFTIELPLIEAPNE